ncbi:hypothetical protein GGI43DRAFT_390367 [Trichoderma evansii]
MLMLMLPHCPAPVPGFRTSRTLMSPFFPFCPRCPQSYVRSMYVGLPQWRATRTQIVEPARHSQRASNNPQILGKWPPSHCRRQPRLISTSDADLRVATALLVRFAHALLGPCCPVACLPLVGRQRSARHCTVTPNTAADWTWLDILPNRTTSPAQFSPAQPGACRRMNRQEGIRRVQLNIGPLFTLSFRVSYFFPSFSPC